MYAVWLESAWSHSYQILQYKRASRSHAKTGFQTLATYRLRRSTQPPVKGAAGQWV